MNRTGKMLSLAVAMLFVASSIFVIAGAFDTDDGREGTLGAAEPISTVEQLIAINTDPTTLGKDYVLTKDLTLPSDFAPIGTNSNPFRGEFDGNGYTITLNMDRSAAAGTYTGLFGYTSNAKIENLKVEGTVISTSTGSFSAYAGGIVGYANVTEITNCHFSGKIEATGGYYAYAGGIAGYAASNSKIIGCSSTGSVKATSSANPASAGGIVGQATNTEIDECSNTGSVTATSSNGNVSAGGIIGFAGSNVDITVCFNSGTVTAASTAEEKLTRAGGIVGGAGGTSTSATVKITNCYNTASVSATGKDDVRAGGTAGMMQFAIVTDCYNVAMVTATSSKVDADAAGSIVGLASDAEINYCFFLKGTVSGDKIAGSAIDTEYDGGKSEPDVSGACTAADMKISAMYVLVGGVELHHSMGDRRSEQRLSDASEQPALRRH